MIFNDDLLFVHVPKTGGMSTSGYLLDVLPKPVYLSHPTEAWNDTLGRRGIIQIVGKRHESLAEARAVVARYGFNFDRFPLILATIRNPYDLEVSRWAYLRQGHDWERGPEQELASSSNFEEFAVRNEQRGGYWATDVRWINRSQRDAYPTYYTPQVEEAVYRRYRWVFDQGLYPRLDPRRLPIHHRQRHPVHFVRSSTSHGGGDWAGTTERLE